MRERKVLTEKQSPNKYIFFNPIQYLYQEETIKKSMRRIEIITFTYRSIRVFCHNDMVADYRLISGRYWYRRNSFFSTTADWSFLRMKSHQIEFDQVPRIVYLRRSGKVFRQFGSESVKSDVGRTRILLKPVQRGMSAISSSKHPDGLRLIVFFGTIFSTYPSSYLLWYTYCTRWDLLCSPWHPPLRSPWTVSGV